MSTQNGGVLRRAQILSCLDPFLRTWEAEVVAFPLTTCRHTIQDGEQRSDFIWVGVGPHLLRRSGEDGYRWNIWVTAVTHAKTQGLDHTDIECASFHHGLGVASACRSRPSLLASADLCRSLAQLEAALKSAALWVEPRDCCTLGYDCTEPFPSHQGSWEHSAGAYLL